MKGPDARPRPHLTTTERVGDVLLLDRRLTFDEVANCSQISHGSSYEIIHNRLGFHKVCARWISKQLTMLHKQTRLDICQQNLDRYDKEGDALLVRIITGDETWVHHYEPEGKRQIMKWKHPQAPIRKKFISQPSAGKLMLTVFWGLTRPNTGTLSGEGLNSKLLVAMRCLLTGRSLKFEANAEDNCRKALG